jgi:arsenate reductase-like glutaredoxin family protein
MSRLTVYENPAYSKCRALAELLEERGIEFQVDPLPEMRIRQLLAKAGDGPREALRTNEDVCARHGDGRPRLGRARTPQG